MKSDVTRVGTRERVRIRMSTYVCGISLMAHNSHAGVLRCLRGFDIHSFRVRFCVLLSTFYSLSITLYFFSLIFFSLSGRCGCGRGGARCRALSSARSRAGDAPQLRDLADRHGGQRGLGEGEAALVAGGRRCLVRGKGLRLAVRGWVRGRG